MQLTRLGKLLLRLSQMLSISLLAVVLALGIYFQGWRPVQPDQARGYTVWFKAATVVYASPGDDALFETMFFLALGATILMILLQVALKPRRRL